ncbi:hypothetical protein KEM52_004692 [Ascosphaera acerosa]|nr:hypothetical protein KEM52_004692 [Ascosphaera acerosa]
MQPLPPASLIASQFTILCPPGTDIWSRPPDLDNINSPILHKTGALRDFRRISAHITSPGGGGSVAGPAVAAGEEHLWTSPTAMASTAAAAAAASTISAEHDMGGIILILHNRTRGTCRWIKAGLEHYSARRNVSVVTKQEFADWSLLPYDLYRGGVTLEMRREKTRTHLRSESLWVYLVVGIQRVPIREVTWVFKDEEEEDIVVMAGAFASRPVRGGVPDLRVVFKQLEVVFAR